MRYNQRIQTYKDEATGETRVASEMLDKVKAMGAEGKTRAAFATEFGVAKTTIDYWRKTYPDFSEAYDVATTAAQAWWEAFGQDNLITQRGDTFNQTIWHRFMASHFRDDWMERHETITRDGDRAELTGKTDDELDDEIAKIEAARAAREAAKAAAQEARARAKAADAGS